MKKGFVNTSQWISCCTQNESHLHNPLYDLDNSHPISESERPLRRINSWDEFSAFF